MTGTFLKKYKHGIHSWKKGETGNLHPNLATKLAAQGVFEISGENYVPTEEDIFNKIHEKEIAAGEVEPKFPQTKVSKR